MNILTHPVTPIAAIVVVVGSVIAIVIKVTSDRRKARMREEARRMRERIARQRIDDLRSNPKPKPRLRRPSAPAPGRPGFKTDARNTDVDHNAGLFIPALLTDYDPTPSRSDSHSSSHDSGSSSSSSDSGSSSSSSDSGSSPSSGGCD